MDRRIGWNRAFSRLIVWEWRIELRNAGTMIVLLPYATTLAVLFFYSLRPTVFQDEKNLMGLLLLALFFMVSMMTARGLQRERESGAFRVFLMSGVERSAYLLARVMVKSLLLSVLLFVYAVLYNVLLAGNAVFFATTLRTVIFLFPCGANLILLGEVVAVLSGGNRIREIVLPLLFFPLSLPLFIVYSGVSAVIEGRAQASSLMMVAGALLLVYAGAGMLFFQFMATDEG